MIGDPLELTMIMISDMSARIVKLEAQVAAGQAMAEAGRYLQKQVEKHRVVYVKHYYPEYKEAVALLAAWDAAIKDTPC